MDIYYRPIPLDGAATQRTLAFINAFNCVLANHRWHADYDDHDGYPGSDLCQENEMALFHLTKIIEVNRAKDLHVELPRWIWFLLGGATVYCSLHLAGVAP